VRRDQLKSPSLDRLLPWLASQKSDLAEALLAQAVEQSPHRAVRGRGALWLARTLAEQAETAQQIRASPEVELLFKDQPEYLNRLKAMDSAKSTRRAEELFELMRKDYANVLQYDGRPTTLGAMAERGLFALRNLAVGKEAPEISGEDLDGRPLKLSDSRGKVVVLVFCGYWCGPCRAMIPQEKALVKKMAGKPFALFWVNSDKDRVLAKAKMEKDGANWRSWWDGGRQDGPIGSRWNVDGFPTVYVIDGKGIIRLKSMGRPGEALDRTVDSLLRKEPGDGTQGGD
jgi:thiol-disulfide isomerase/thioredoxin